jgi:hypothetical protein
LVIPKKDKIGLVRIPDKEPFTANTVIIRNN